MKVLYNIWDLTHYQIGKISGQEKICNSCIQWEDKSFCDTYSLFVSDISGHKSLNSFFTYQKIKILDKYVDYINIFLEEKATILREITDLDQHAIKLQKNYQPSYSLI